MSFSEAFADGPKLPDTPAALAHLFAGIVTLADQLGSVEEFSKFESEPDPDYIARAHRRASDAIRTADSASPGARGARAPPGSSGSTASPQASTSSCSPNCFAICAPARSTEILSNVVDRVSV